MAHQTWQRALRAPLWKRLQGVGQRHARNLIPQTVLMLPLVWLVILFLLPMLIIGYISLTVPASAIPPFLHIFGWDADFFSLTISLSFESYFNVVDDPVFGFSVLNALRISLITASITSVAGLAIALSINALPKQWHLLFLGLMVLPFTVSFLVRVYAWIGILRNTGLINTVFGYMGLGPFDLIDNDRAMVIGLVYTYLPFAVFPIYVAVERIPRELYAAARDLGAKPGRYFVSVVLPLCVPGLLAAWLLVFIPVSGDIVVPELLGGTDAIMVGRTIWLTFFTSRDWPTAAALSIVLLVVVILPILLVRNYIDKTMQFRY
ncbi:MAG: ABC transporter permease [Alphaproteobacteria bacterium]|nr:ABC transporter permease [Alphaproteobacteria bacterium]